MGEQKRKKKKTYYFKSSKNSTAAFIIILCVVAVVGIDYKQRHQTSPLDKYDQARSKGNVEAPLRITEFVDFTCEQCARGSKLLKEYMQKYPDGIFLDMKYFPLGALNSMIAAKYAECAAEQDKFWAFHDFVFENQSEWGNLLKIKKYFAKISPELKLDVPKLEACVEHKQTGRAVDKDRILGEAHSVRSTPTYFVNGKMFVGVESLRKALLDFFDDPTADLL